MNIMNALNEFMKHVYTVLVVLAHVFPDSMKLIYERLPFVHHLFVIERFHAVIPVPIAIQSTLVAPVLTIVADT